METYTGRRWTKAKLLLRCAELFLAADRTMENEFLRNMLIHADQKRAREGSAPRDMQTKATGVDGGLATDASTVHRSTGTSRGGPKGPPKKAPHETYVIPGENLGAQARRDMLKAAFSSTKEVKDATLYIAGATTVEAEPKGDEEVMAWFYKNDKTYSLETILTHILGVSTLSIEVLTEKVFGCGMNPITQLSKEVLMEVVAARPHFSKLIAKERRKLASRDERLANPNMARFYMEWSDELEETYRNSKQGDASPQSLFSQGV